MEGKVVSSAEISRLAHLHFSEEQAVRGSGSLLYIGNAKESAAPFFLDCADAMNPHIFIFGMSGSGKSYLTKSLVVRMSVLAEYSVLLLDFTGEYREYVSAIFCEEVAASLAGNTISPGKVSYVDLSKFTEAAKISSAREILARITQRMRSAGTSEKFRTFIVLDEAWKLLLSDDSLSILIREGRKYGVGLLLASQIIGDVDESLLSNIATVFAFRVQDAPSIDKMARCYELGSDKVSAVQNLDQGSCLVVQLHKDKRRSSFFIDRVVGVGIPKQFALKYGGLIRIEIEEKKFSGFLKKLGLDGAQATAIKALFTDGYSTELSKLMLELVQMVNDRNKILAGMRGMGLGDKEIAEAFAEAVSQEEFGADSNGYQNKIL
ncbi:MAG: ATP-binding protein [Candidatus Micrarchaeota archaeon]|nr:ATP-binding protein [Candidatus Micrarchaeota archaeon]